MCQQCELMAKSNQALKWHISADHEELEYSCQKCDFKTKWTTSLNDHFKTNMARYRIGCTDWLNLDPHSTILGLNLDAPSCLKDRTRVTPSSDLYSVCTT